jgi:flagellar hook-associated protein 3 FlgL
MKTSTVSNIAITNTLRMTMQNAQKQLMVANAEATSGQYADVGLILGSGTARSLDLGSDVSRIDSLMDTNAIATQRLESSQSALDSMANAAQSINEALIALSGSDDAASIAVANQTVSNALATFTNAANTSVNGEYLFAGINTDVQPLDDYATPDSTAKAAFDQLLGDYMTANGIATKADFTAEQMATFIDGTLTPAFTGDDWKTNWSDASDTNITSRISKSEVVATSTNANSDGMRYFALASVMSMELMTPEFSSAARSVASDKAVSAIGQAISGIDGQRSQLGLSESRVSKANDALDAQKNIIENYLTDLKGVDVTEAATRVQNLKTLLETSYTLTSQIQGLSLLNYL